MKRYKSIRTAEFMGGFMGVSILFIPTPLYTHGDKFSGIWEYGHKKHGLHTHDGKVSRRVYADGRLVSLQDFDAERGVFLPTVRRDVHLAPMKRCCGRWERFGQD